MTPNAPAPPLDRLPQPDLLHAWLVGALLADRFTRLSTFAQDEAHRLTLHDTFFDLPARGESTDINGIVAALIQRMEAPSTPSPAYRSAEAPRPRPDRLLVLGGPGQGKTSIAMRLGQLLRAALLRGHPGLTFEERALVEAHPPAPLRLPWFVNLPTFADRLADGRDADLSAHLAHVTGRLARQVAPPPGLVERWAEALPGVLILDGLDEVPISANRGPVLDAISAWISAREAAGAQLFVVMTSRPQGYGGEAGGWGAWELRPLSPQHAQTYGEGVLRRWYASEPLELDRQLGRLKRELQDASVQALAVSPLNVVLLTLLISRMGRAPRDRWRLFRDYYRLVFERERDRDLSTATILHDQPELVDQLHWELGYRLQVQSEEAGETGATLDPQTFEEEVLRLLERRKVRPADREALRAQLREVLLGRLVFLSAREEGRLGFDVRSLQEMAAAERMFLGPERELVARLGMLSCSNHWRNVLCLVVSQIAATRDHLLGEVVGLCRALDRDGERGPARLGTRLAVHLLSAGVLDGWPEEERALAELVEPALWVDLGVEEALWTRVFEVLLEFDRVLLVSSMEAAWSSRKWSRGWLWLSEYSSVFKYEYERAANHWRTKFRQHLIEEFGQLDVPDDRLLELAVFCGNVPLEGLRVQLIAMAPGYDGWLPQGEWTALRRFAHHPCAMSLADALDEIAGREVNEALLLDFVPWPLSACLSHTRWPQGKEQLAKLANRVRDGQLGDTWEWRMFEERVKSKGIDLLLDDVEWPVGFPFGKQISDRGVPDCEYSMSGNSVWSRGSEKLSKGLPSVSPMLIGLASFALEMSGGTVGPTWAGILLEKGSPWVAFRWFVENGCPHPFREVARRRFHTVEAQLAQLYVGRVPAAISVSPAVEGWLLSLLSKTRIPAVLAAIVDAESWLLTDISNLRDRASALLILLRRGLLHDSGVLAPMAVELLADLGPVFEDELCLTLDRQNSQNNLHHIEGDNLHRFIDALWPLLPPGSLRDRLGPHLARSILSRPSPFLDPERTERVGLPAPRTPRRTTAPAPLVDLRFLRLELRGVRVIGDLDLDLCQESTLGGRWTCLVGLNGAGKTTILQCLAVLLLGPARALDLGANAIAALRSPEAPVATLTLHISLDGRPLRIGLRLSNGGTIEPTDEHKADWPQARQALERALVCAYGASRNLGGDDAIETDESRSVEARRLRSLFDPRALIPSAERLRAVDGLDSDHQRLFTEVVEAAMEDYGVKVHTDRRGTTFSIEGQSSVRAAVLPDGFRATVAWINDLCRHAVERAGPIGAPTLRAKDLRGLVIIDEIDLHLHARMQRTIVARLRKALPGLTWLVTTHSPLVVSAFDKAELRVLDRVAPGRLRPVDRQIYGFSLNDIVDMLLDPDAPGDWESKPLQELREEVRKAGRNASQELRDRLILAQEVSAKIDEDEAWRRIYLRRSRGRRDDA